MYQISKALPPLPPGNFVAALPPPHPSRMFPLPQLMQLSCVDAFVCSVDEPTADQNSDQAAGADDGEEDKPFHKAPDIPAAISR
jgi:hypothetical protein